MNEAKSTNEKKIIIKVRRKIRPKKEKIDTRLKVVKIAKKIKNENGKEPFPESVQEDFLLEKSNTPELFLRNSNMNTKFQIVSPSNRSQINSGNSFRVNKDIASNNFFSTSPVSRNKNPILKDIDKIGGNRNKILLQEIEKKPQNLREGAKTDRSIHENSEKVTVGRKLNDLKQCKSLEKYEQQKDYWKKIEANIADKIQKAPDELSLNSSKIFEIKRAEIDAIERLQKSNEKTGKLMWTESLREGLYKVPDPPMNASPGLGATFDCNPKYSQELLKYTKKGIVPRGDLIQNEYFKSKFQEYQHDRNLILNFFDFRGLEVNGKSKMKMEIDAARRKGIKIGINNKESEENFTEQVIESKYDPKVLY